MVRRATVVPPLTALRIHAYALSTPFQMLRKDYGLATGAAGAATADAGGAIGVHRLCDDRSRRIQNLTDLGAPNQASEVVPSPPGS
jgi:hypothetical protein